MTLSGTRTGVGLSPRRHPWPQDRCCWTVLHRFSLSGDLSPALCLRLERRPRWGTGPGKVWAWLLFNSFLITCFWLHWVFVPAQGLLSSCGAWASHCGGLSLCRAQSLGGASSVVVLHGLSCSVAYGIFLDWGSNLCLLHWQADS